ncbi:MAG: hypothetical protein U0183_11955 [Polyangiaceae bacterium]
MSSAIVVGERHQGGLRDDHRREEALAPVPYPTRRAVRRGREAPHRHMPSEAPWCGSFEELLDTVERARSKRFGPLAVYDTALRIGANVGQLPELVYLHAGTRKGCETLFGREATRGKMSLSKDDFPKEVQALEPHEIEDFMCIFKDDFAGAPQSAKKSSRRCCTDDATLEGERLEKRRC